MRWQQALAEFCHNAAGLRGAKVRGATDTAISFNTPESAIHTSATRDGHRAGLFVLVSP